MLFHLKKHRRCNLRKNLKVDLGRTLLMNNFYKIKLPNTYLRMIYWKKLISSGRLMRINWKDSKEFGLI